MIVALRRLAYAGRRRLCPCCERRYRRFRTSPWGHPEQLCPGCDSRSRHRVLLLYLQRETDLFTRPARVLHFAAEPYIARHLRELPHLDYVTADLNPRIAMVEADMTELPFEDGRFDCVLVSHVLEHIPDDRLAMRELRRILDPSGRAILQHPVEYAFDTYEDSTVQSSEQRRLAFGQEDHVRVYGRDFPDRLREAGFDVEMVRYEERLPADLVARHCLRDLPGTLKADDIYVCSHSALRASTKS